MRNSIRLTSLIGILLIIFASCERSNAPVTPDAPGFNPLISAFSSGLISAESNIQVRFAQTIKDSVFQGEEVKKSVFKIQPEIDGSAYYIDNQTIEFRPTTKFASGKAYDVEVRLNQLFDQTGKDKSFNFRFHTLEQHLEIKFSGFRPYDDYKPEKNYLTGVVRTTDAALPQHVEDVMQAFQDNDELHVSWTHSPDRKMHEFTIDSVVRKESEDLVEISFNGKPIQSKNKGKTQFKIPALGDFKVIDHRIVQYPEQHVILQFSDPIRKDQYLNGLIRLSNDTDMRYIVDGNSIKAYPNVRQNGPLTLMVEAGIRNTAGKSLKAGDRFEITFEEIKPAIQLLGDGVIIPTADEVILPFKAVNLRAIDVKVIRIYENNIAQFLQVNRLSGNRELKRAGRLISKKTIDLVADQAINYGQWNTFSLDLTDIVQTEPGAIYRVEMNFRQHQSMFPCAGDQQDELSNAETSSFNVPTAEDMTYYDSYESYYSNWDYYNYEGYTWVDRDDPCKPAYYGTRRTVARNVLASDLGLIAKYGSRELHVTVTGLLDARPLSGVKVQVFNLQMQLLAEGITNQQGNITLNPDSRPFLVVAESQNQKGYLRMVEGGALSYSMFDVSGNIAEKDIKGFIYGERGVWRPGDSIFLNLIIDDHLNPLPSNHPVTFELKNPLGKIVQTRVVSGSNSGFYPFYTRTMPDAPTGHYTVTASVGGLHFSKMMQVETIKPNRLKIDLDFHSDTIYPVRGPILASLKGKWLTGATARNLRAEVEVALKNASTSFEKFNDYTFSNPVKQISHYSNLFWQGNLNMEGNASIMSDLKYVGDAPGMLSAVFTTRLFEPSGEFSIDQKAVTCSPYNTYVGIKTPPGDKRNMLLTDTSHLVKVVTVSPEGEPQTKLGLDVKVYKLSWRWWWDASNENLASYMGSSHQTPVYSTNISTNNGHGSFNFRVNYPDWGRYLIVVSDRGGHSAGKIVYVDWPGWSGRARKGDPDASTILTFSADKPTYQVGETAQITIPSSIEGRILISLEKSSDVIRQEWVEANGSETKYQFMIEPEMAPNIYISATLIQPHSQTINDLPIRMFGVIPIMVEDPDTRLHPILKMPDELSPNSTVSIQVSEQDRREMTYTIAMVDEGLLDLTRFRTPDPWAGFYSKEALGVKTWDMFEHVLGAYGGRIDGIYSIGGGLEESSEGSREASRFPPMVKFIGPFTLEGKSNTHKVEIPNYVGSVRTMIIAGQHGAYGFAHKTTPVKQPLMVIATLPRVLGPGEEVSLPVNVFVMDENIRNVELEITMNDMLISGETKKTISFNGTGDEIVDFKLHTPVMTGKAKVGITAVAGNHKATYEIDLEVRSPNPPLTNYITKTMDAGENLSEVFTYVGMPGTNSVDLEVSNIPPIDFGRRMKYLLRYPHGCVEQTTSAAFPQLFLSDVAEVNQAVKAKTEAHVKAAIRRLMSFQLPDGAFSYWPGAARASDWGTSYAGHFLIEAAEKGYDIPRGMVNNWLRYQRKTSRRWSISGSTNQYEIMQEQLLQAYRLFTLALNGEAEMGAMNRLRERTDLVPEAKWRLAATYALAGQQETARTLISGVPVRAEEYHDSRYSFGSQVRDQSMILESMILMGMRENGSLLLEQIAQKLSSDRWMSTQTTAYALIAVAKFTEGKTSDKELKFQYAFRNKPLQKVSTGMPFAQIEMITGSETEAQLDIQNNSGGIQFVRIINLGLPAPGNEKAISNNLQVTVSYEDLTGNTINPGSIIQGTDFRAIYRVYNPGTAGMLDNVALTTIFPSGWEIHNERMFSTGNDQDPVTYQDIRDDRVYTYFSLAPNQTKTISVRLNAAYKGKYYLPLVKAEEMYKNDVQVVIPGRWIEIPARDKR